VASLATWRRAVGQSMARCCGPRAAAGPLVHPGPEPGLSGRGRRCCSGAPLARGRRSPGRLAGPRGGEPRAGLRRARCGGCRARLGRGRGWPGRAGRAAARGGGGLLRRGRTCGREGERARRVRERVRREKAVLGECSPRAERWRRSEFDGGEVAATSAAALRASKASLRLGIAARDCVGGVRAR